jgi:hypothetical protein
MLQVEAFNDPGAQRVEARQLSCGDVEAL